MAMETFLHVNKSQRVDPSEAIAIARHYERSSKPLATFSCLRFEVVATK